MRSVLLRSALPLLSGLVMANCLGCIVSKPANWRPDLANIAGERASSAPKDAPTVEAPPPKNLAQALSDARASKNDQTAAAPPPPAPPPSSSDEGSGIVPTSAIETSNSASPPAKPAPSAAPSAAQATPARIGFDDLPSVKSDTTKTAAAHDSSGRHQDDDVLSAQVENELINVGDTVEVRFPFRKELDVAQAVRDDGKIALPFVGPVVALGKTPETLREDICGLYSAIRYDPAYNASNAGSRRYLISAGDELEIHFDSQKEYNEKVIVRPDGRISLPRVKSVLAEGRTPEELEQELTERYRPFVSDPSLVVIVRGFASNLVYVNGQAHRLGLKDVDQVSVLVTRSSPRMIYVAGEVNNPGVVPYRVPMTALRAITAAGGPKHGGKMSEVIVLRKLGSGAPVSLRVDLRPEIRGERTTDGLLRPYDIVVVP